MRVLRRLAALLPSSWLQWLALALRPGTTVSVVVRVTDDNAVLLDELVDVLGRQRRKADEILLMVAGSALGTRRAVTRQERSSWRVRTFLMPGEGPVAQRAAAVGHARGSYLWFLEAGDLPTLESVAEMAGALDRTGADVVLSSADADGEAVMEDWPDLLRGRELRTIMMRRSAYPLAAERAETGPLDDWLPALRLLLGVRRVALCTADAVRGPRRGQGAAFGAIPVLAPWVDRWVSAVEDCLDVLHERHDESLDAFVSWLLASECPRWAADAERCSPEQWAVLVAELQHLWDLASEEARLAVSPEDRVLVWMGAQGRRVEVEEYAALRWREEQHPTRVAAGRVHAVLPVEDVPDEVLELSRWQTRLRLLPLRSEVSDEGDLAVELAAWVENVGDQHGASRVEATLVLPDGAAVPLPCELADDADLERLAGERYQDHRQSMLRLTVPADYVSEAGQGARLEVRREAAGILRVGWQPLPLPPRAGAAGAPTVVTGVWADGDDLVAELSGAPGEGPWQLDGPVRVAARLEQGAKTWRLRVRLRHDPWGAGEIPLPSGAYVLRSASGEALTLADGFPPAGLDTVVRPDHHRVRVERGVRRRCRLFLAAPLADDEAGPRAQHRLREAYSVSSAAVDASLVYLQAYAGLAPTDSPAALARELRVARPDLRLVWGVADRSHPVPETDEAVLVGSRAWYDVLATAGAVVTNVDLEEWFVKRPGQRVLQTFHGYPSKTMGLAAWEGKNLTPRRIERLLRRTSGTWDLLLTPTPEMDALYRDQYLYSGAIHSLGYPRDDDLVGDQSERRERVRDLLGLGDRTAVLYAPTWRDDLATNWRVAPLATTFDVERAADVLGEDVVVLLRGHRFHRTRADLAGRIIDVTTYPEINDLILASDAAVLDYSSLRFDFALTGRPMVFLVPDLDRYEGARGFLYDFASSAPGPKVSTTEEAVAQLRDLPGLTAAHAEEYAAFRERFLTHMDGQAARRVAETFFGR